MRLMPPRKRRFPLLNERELSFEYYEEEDFVEYWLGIDDLVITSHNVQSVLKDILAVVNACFERFPSVRFATGIYELTAYYLGDVKSYSEFDHNILRQFPFVFLREKNQFGFLSETKFHNVWYVVNSGNEVQNICDREPGG